MKTIRALILIVILLLIVCLSGLVALAFLPPIPTVTDKPDIPVNTPSVEDVILPLTEDAGEEYINKLYFVGDSTTLHFWKGGIDRSHILVPDSDTLQLTSNINNEIMKNTGLTISKSLKELDAEFVIITLGVNGADRFTELKYKTYYKKLISDIKAESPDTVIIIQSVFPITKWKNDEDIGITNVGIDRLNEWCKEIAFDEELHYLDTQSVLKDENGAQIEEYNNGDGIHMNNKAYEAILQYIRTHAVLEKE